MSVLVKGMKMPKNCGECFVGDRTICHDKCPLSDAGEEFMKHYRQGREDEKAEANGTLMQAFNPD